MADTAGTSIAQYPFTLSSSADPGEVVRMVAEHGLAHIPHYLTGPTLDRLAAEAEQVLDDQSDWVNHEAYSLGKSVRLVRKEIDRNRYPSIPAVFEGPELERLVEGHFGEGYVFAEQIYVIWDVVGSETHVQELHYDKIQHLKIFLYLSDVGPGNGPFHCVPGTHLFGREAQRENRQRRIIPTDPDVRVLPEEFRSRTMSVLGPAGTLIVFDSDLAHHAGVPTDGPRLAARSLNFGAGSLGRRL